MFHYGFSAAMGGGEYERRPTFDTALGPVATVASPGPIQPALDARAVGGVVELSDSGRFEETPCIALECRRCLEIRAANEHRPTLIVAGPLDITAAQRRRTLNGLLIAGGPIRILSALGDTLRKVRLLHFTLVSGIVVRHRRHARFARKRLRCSSSNRNAYPNRDRSLHSRRDSCAA